MSAYNKVSIGRAFTWYGDGWRIFTAKPILLLVSLILYVLILSILAFIPILGGFISALITPALLAGLFLLAESIERNQTPGFSTFLEPIKDTQVRWRLLGLGALSIGFGILLLILLLASLGTAALTSDLIAADASPTPAQLTQLFGSGSALIGIVATMLLSFFFMLAMFYAPPLVLFRTLPPWASVRLSLNGSLGNILPLLVFGITSLVLLFIAMLPAGLGLLVLAPVLTGASYASYLDIFEGNGEDNAGTTAGHQAAAAQRPQVKTVDRS